MNAANNFASVMHGRTVLVCQPEGAVIGHERDAVDVIGDAFGQHATVVVIPVSRLAPEFFTLSTRIAGEVIQKFVNYRLQLVIVGDISEPLARSSALRAFVHESNMGRHIWFLDDLTQLDDRLRRDAAAAAVG
jgi:hypothetical protein